MFHFSYTTFRELKKRYINILKKCLLVNLGIIIFSVSAFAESTAIKNDGTGSVVIKDAQNDGSELLAYLKDETYYVVTDGVFNKIIVDSDGETVSYLGVPIVDSNGSPVLDANGNKTYTYERLGGILKNTGTLGFEGGLLVFKNGSVYSKTPNSHAQGAAIYNSGTITFDNQVSFLDNTSITGSWNTRAMGTVYNSGIMNFNQHVVFKNNYSDGSYFVGEGAAIYNTNKMNFTSVDFIGNKSGTEDVLNYAGASSAIENTSKGTIIFTGLTNFKDNEVWKVSGGNGIISNAGRIELQDKTTFQNNKLIVAGENEAYGAVLSNSGTIIIADVDFTGNSSSAGLNSYGGAISNSKNLTFNGASNFSNNTGSANKGFSIGGAVYNTGTLTFKGDTSFKDNKAITQTWTGYGGAIFNNNQGKIIFERDAWFENNYAKGVIMSSGGAVAMEVNGSITFGGKSYFINNVSEGVQSARAGAVSIGWQGGSITFKDNATFLNNTVKGPAGSVQGGAYFNENDNSFTTFTNGFYFDGNREIEVVTKEDGSIAEIEHLNDIYIGGGIIYLKGDNPNSEEYIGGGIRGGKGVGTIDKSSVGTFLLAESSDNTGYTGIFNQTAGKTIANSETFFRGTNNIDGGELETHGSEIAYTAIVGETGTLTHLGLGNKSIEIKGLSFKEEGTDLLMTFKSSTSEQAVYQLNENIENLKGNRLMFDNAELDVAAGLKVVGTVVSKNMILSKGTAPVSLSDLVIAENTVLNIQNRTVEAETLIMNDNSVLNVDLNTLVDHGKMNVGEVKEAEKGLLSLTLKNGLNQETGVYQVFNKDNELGLIENNLFDIKDLENGAYEISKKETSELMSEFSLTKTQGEITSALIDGNSSNEAFSKMQEEILTGLQSDDKMSVEEAKKALKAVGTSEQPSSQAMVVGHFNDLTRVISQLVMEKEAELGCVVDKEARAKVYIKGLYDKTKSTMGEGFKARSQGAVLGIQSEVTEDLTLGVGYATSKTTAKEELRRTEVDTNTGFISAHYQPNAWWMSGLVTYSRGQYDEEKQVLSSVGTANYDVDSWGVQVMTGYDIKLQNAIITPEVGLRYLSVKQEGYTDTLGTTVEATSSDYLTAIAGVKTAWDLGKIRPTVGINVGYDVISDDVSALNTLANGASYTVNSEALDRLSVGISTGVEAKLNDRTTLKLEYNGSFRKEYKDHSGMLKLELKF